VDSLACAFRELARAAVSQASSVPSNGATPEWCNAAHVQSWRPRRRSCAGSRLDGLVRVVYESGDLNKLDIRLHPVELDDPLD
jgi:hypothetical protein